MPVKSCCFQLHRRHRWHPSTLWMLRCWGVPKLPCSWDGLVAFAVVQNCRLPQRRVTLKGINVTWSLSTLTHLVSQVLNQMHCLMINSFGNQYPVLILLHKMGWRSCSVTNNKTEGVSLPAEAKLNIKGCSLGHSSLGHFEVDGSSSTCSNGKCSQHSFIFTCSTCLSWHVYLKAWESYPVPSNRLSTHILLPSCLFPKGGSVPPLRGKLADGEKQRLHAISVNLLFPLWPRWNFCLFHHRAPNSSHPFFPRSLGLAFTQAAQAIDPVSRLPWSK